jgi:hypothetical protein
MTGKMTDHLTVKWTIIHQTTSVIIPTLPNKDRWIAPLITTGKQATIVSAAGPIARGLPYIPSQKEITALKAVISIMFISGLLN